MLCAATRRHVRQVSLADLAEEESPVLQVHDPVLCDFQVQLLLQLQGQSLVTVHGLQVEG